VDHKIILLMLALIVLFYGVQVVSGFDWKPEELDELSYFT
jgi:hypothetical protein